MSTRTATMAPTMVEPPKVSKSGSIGLLAGGAEFLGLWGSVESDAKVELDVPSTDSYVICAVLDDAESTRVRIGAARYYTSSKTYHMLDGSLKVKESDKSADDGLYRDGGGTYALMTEPEYTEYVNAQKIREREASIAKLAAAAILDAPVPCLSPVAKPQNREPAATRSPPSVTAVLPAVVAPSKPSSAPPAAVAEIGCGAGSDTRTVISMGNFEGDGTRMSVVAEQTIRVATKAAARGNRVCYAVMGNVVPDVHHAASNGGNEDDSLTRALQMATRVGVNLGSGFKVSPEDVTLIIGPRELGWLRLINPVSSKREITRFDDPDAMSILRRKTLLHDRVDATTLPTWLAHDTSLGLFGQVMKPNVLAVAMLLKLVSVSQMTMNAPGLVKVFAQKLSNRNHGDPVSYISLFSFLDTYNGTIEAGMERLITGGEKEDEELELTMEGLGLMPAAKDVVNEVLEFASTEVKAYLKKGKIAHCVINGDANGGDGGLWLSNVGTEDGRMVGNLPVGIASEGIAVAYKAIESDKVAWSKQFNRTFRSFLRRFDAGDVDDNLFKAYIATAVASHNTPLPLKNLRTDTHSSCQGVCSNTSTPFGTIQRRVLVDGSMSAGVESDLVRVLESWSGINTDAYTPSTYWSVATWCGGTQADLEAPMPLFNRSEKMSTHLYNVSVTLASLLSTPVGDRSVGDFGFEGLNGLLGPVVSASAHGSANGIHQPVRLVSFTHESIDSAFVLLLPEAFVQASLDYANYDIERYTRGNEPFMSVEGFVALPDESAIPLNLPGLSAAEVDGIRADLGTRVWALPKKRSEKGIASFTTADYAAISAMRKSDASSRTLTIPGYKILHTQQGSLDPFSGLNVGLARVPGKARMTLDTDTTTYHSLFRVVGRK